MISGSRKPIAQLDTAIRKTITNSNVLTYSVNKYKGKHDFDFLVGQETYDLEQNHIRNWLEDLQISRHLIMLLAI